MAKKKPATDKSDSRNSRPASRTQTEQVRLAADLTYKGRIIAATLGLKLPEYVNERLRAIIEEEYPRIVSTLASGTEPPESK